MNLKYILGFVAVVALIIVYYKFNPEMYNLFPACPFHKYVGLDCPGCGSQRAIHALLHGKILLAINYNLLLVISLPFLLVHFGLKIYSYFAKKDKTWIFWYRPVTPKIIFGIVLTFWVLRNIPCQPFNYLAS